MPNLLARIEDALLSEARAATRGLCRAYETAPAEWDANIARQLLNGAPAVYAAFLGYRKKPGYYQWPKIARFALYCVTADGPEDARRRGDLIGVGAYDLAIACDTALDGFLLRDADGEAIATLDVEGVESLFSDKLWDMGGTCYGLEITMPVCFDLFQHPDDLASNDPPPPLQRVHTDWDVQPFATGNDHERWLGGDRTTAPAPDAQDETELPQ